MKGNLIGPAFTLRYIPAREDIDSYGVKPDLNTLQREAVDSVPEGHVLVMDCCGDPRAASAGDVYVTTVRHRALVSGGAPGAPIFPKAPSGGRGCAHGREHPVDLASLAVRQSLSLAISRLRKLGFPARP